VRGPGASQQLDEHPWSPQPHTLSVLFLPACVGKLLGDNRLAHRHQLMDFAPMQALAMGSQLALFGRFAWYQLYPDLLNKPGHQPFAPP
jgi:hypothetical protein